MDRGVLLFAADVFLSLPLAVVLGPLWMLVRNWNFFNRLHSAEIRSQLALTPIPPEILLRCYIEKPVLWSILPFAVSVLMQTGMICFAILGTAADEAASVEVLWIAAIVLIVVAVFSLIYYLWIALFYIYLFSYMLKNFKQSCETRGSNILVIQFIFSYVRSFVIASAVTFLTAFLLIVGFAFIINIAVEIFGWMNVPKDIAIIATLSGCCASR